MPRGVEAPAGSRRLGEWSEPPVYDQEKRDGIRFASTRYLSPVLAAYVGETVTIRYDPRDAAELRVYHHDQYLCRAIAPELKNRGHFPSDAAAIKLLWLAIRTIEDKRARERAKEAGTPKGQSRKAPGHLVEGATIQGWKTALAIYDVSANTGWVSVGVDHDTSAFAVATLRSWWDTIGRTRYPTAGRLLICADGGGSNGSRVRAWKIELAAFAADTGLRVTVAHLPPGTSKWNKIEHRLFSPDPPIGVGV